MSMVIKGMVRITNEDRQLLSSLAINSNHSYYVHKIVHISALFYQSLSIISASGRELLKMKNSNNNKIFNT